MLFEAFKPSNDTASEPRKVLPFAPFGISHVQTAPALVTREVCARSGVAPARPTHVTRPFWMTAPVSERAVRSRIVNGFPATGPPAGVVVNFRTTIVGLTIFTV
jgi:hypothetical protein